MARGKSRLGALLVLEATDTYEDGASFAWSDDKTKLFISVSEEKAVDSYNAMFECTLTATLEQARQLRDWLNRTLPE